MREIKFRAWNPNTKKITDDFLIIPNRGVALQWFDDGHTGNTLEHFILLQYTGLTDKNGKEIYEGDVVTHPYNQEETITMTLDPHQVHKLVELGEWDMLGHSEIIGNIYENPELIANEDNADQKLSDS